MSRKALKLLLLLVLLMLLLLLFTCGIGYKHQGHNTAYEACPAHHPELGSVTDVVEEDGGGQGS